MTEKTPLQNRSKTVKQSLRLFDIFSLLQFIVTAATTRREASHSSSCSTLCRICILKLPNGASFGRLRPRSLPTPQLTRLQPPSREIPKIELALAHLRYHVTTLSRHHIAFLLIRRRIHSDRRRTDTAI
jgi:hypothetical protein